MGFLLVTSRQLAGHEVLRVRLYDDMDWPLAGRGARAVSKSKAVNSKERCAVMVLWRLF